MALAIAREIETMMGFPRGRLTAVIKAVHGLPFKTGVQFIGNPPLSPEETERIIDTMRVINDALGGSPLMTDADLPPEIRAMQKVD